MKIFNFFVTILRPVKLVMLAATCMLLFLSSVSPAFAISSYQSNPQEGTTQLLETQRKTDEVAKSQPLSREKVQEESNKGLNEVQGDADIQKMKNPRNSQSSTSVEENVQNFLEKITGQK
jgi:hypothetical protein